MAIFFGIVALLILVTPRALGGTLAEVYHGFEVKLAYLREPEAEAEREREKKSREDYRNAP